MYENKRLFNTKFFIINSKITDLCSCPRSAELIYIYIHAHASSCLLESGVKWHTPISTLNRMHNTPIHLWAQSELKRRHTHTHTGIYNYAWLLAQTHIYLVARSSFTITGAFPAHVCRYTQLSYLFHQCRTSLFSRDACIANFTMKGRVF